MFGFGNKEGSRPNFGVESERVIAADAELFGQLMNLKHCGDKLSGEIIDLVKAIGCSCSLNEKLHAAVLELIEAKKEDFKRD